MYDLCLVGGGLSSMSLLQRLYSYGYTGRILLLEKERAFPSSRTWGFWQNTFDNPFSALVESSFPSWSFCTEHTQVTCGSETHRYSVIRGASLYEHLERNILPALTVERLWEQEVTGIEEYSDHVELRTRNEERYKAKKAILSALNRSAWKTDSKSLFQVFYGIFLPNWNVTNEQAKLMDVQVSDGEHFDFIYDLTLANGSRLIEYTRISREITPRFELKKKIEGYLSRELGIQGEAPFEDEYGIIPMFPIAYPQVTERIGYIGQNFGASRPSSGYTFHEIQRQSEHYSRLINDKLSFCPPPPLPRHLRFMDKVFLEVLSSDLALAPGLFSRFFSCLTGEGFARFMMSKPSFTDVLRVIRAFPARPFLAATFKSVIR